MDPADPASDWLRDRLLDGKLRKIAILSIVAVLLFYSSFHGYTLISNFFCPWTCQNEAIHKEDVPSFWNLSALLCVKEDVPSLTFRRILKDTPNIYVKIRWIMRPVHVALIMSCSMVSMRRGTADTFHLSSKRGFSFLSIWDKGGGAHWRSSAQSLSANPNLYSDARCITELCCTRLMLQIMSWLSYCSTIHRVNIVVIGISQNQRSKLFFCGQCHCCASRFHQSIQRIPSGS